MYRQQLCKETADLTERPLHAIAYTAVQFFFKMHFVVDYRICHIDQRPIAPFVYIDDLSHAATKH